MAVVVGATEDAHHVGVAEAFLLQAGTEVPAIPVSARITGGVLHYGGIAGGDVLLEGAGAHLLVDELVPPGIRHRSDVAVALGIVGSALGLVAPALEGGDGVPEYTDLGGAVGVVQSHNLDGDVGEVVAVLALAAHVDIFEGAYQKLVGYTFYDYALRVPFACAYAKCVTVGKGAAAGVLAKGCTSFVGGGIHRQVRGNEYAHIAVGLVHTVRNGDFDGCGEAIGDTGQFGCYDMRTGIVLGCCATEIADP